MTVHANPSGEYYGLTGCCRLPVTDVHAAGDTLARDHGQAVTCRTEHEREVWVQASIERAALREQAWFAYKSELESAERAYQRNLADIDRVYRLRTGETDD